MMKQLLAPTLTAFVLATSAQAGAPLSGEAFDDYSLGKTLYFGLGGTPYGAEEYLPNQRVRWSFLDGHCKEGRWYQEGAQICFVYEDNPDPQCWTFSKGGRGLVATYENDTSSTTLYEVEQSSEPMICLGPEVGV